CAQPNAFVALQLPALSKRLPGTTDLLTPMLIAQLKGETRKQRMQRVSRQGRVASSKKITGRQNGAADTPKETVQGMNPQGVRGAAVGRDATEHNDPPDLVQRLIEDQGPGGLAVAELRVLIQVGAARGIGRVPHARR